ncbi:transposase, IS4 family protein [Burkholderia lata]|nr:transposase, IS4 family protein [Burkholderia lata]
MVGKRRLLLREHFVIDGTPGPGLGSHKTFRPKDALDDPPASVGRNADTDWKCKRRSNDPHESSMDPDTRSTAGSCGAPAATSSM